MAENKTQDPYYDDVIDLRELFQTLLNYKWIITVATLLTALVAFLVSAFLLPEQYEATSYVIITKPSLIADLEPSIQIDPSIPDTEALTHLFLADSILHEVYEIKEVDQALGKEIKFADFKGKFKAKLVGSSQLELLVIDTDPFCADLLADTWAQVVVDRLNTLYGTNQNAFIQLDTQLQTAKETWDEKQRALEISIAQSLVPALEGQLAQEEVKLSSIHAMIDQHEFLIADLLMFRELLSYRPAQQELRFEDVLAIMTLQRRWVGPYDNLQIQVDKDTLLGASYTVDQTQEMIDNIITVLSQQNQELEDSLNEQEIIIPALTANLEDEQYKLDQLIDERDLARSAYTALSGQLEETRITLAQEDQIAKIAAGAHKPDVPVSPRKLMNTALAGLAGLILITGGVLLFDWWIGNNKPVPSGESV